MVVISIKEDHYLHENIGKETILKEFKEFFLRKSLTLDDINDLKKGYMNSKTQRYLYESTKYYMNKYLNRYMLSLTNISKIFLPNLLDQTHSKFYIGVSDEGIINGIPFPSYMIENLKQELILKMTEYYDNILGLHYNKGSAVIMIGDETYYDFSKLINILKKHTKINIHILKNDNKKNIICDNLLKKINGALEEEKKYHKDLKEHKILKKKKCDYNDKYSQAFHKLIRSDVMDEFREYTEIPLDKFNNLLKMLHNKIKEHNDVEKYLKNGLYIDRSLFPEDKELDDEYGSYMHKYIEEYKQFKMIQLKKNIVIKSFSQKNPIKKINPILKNISCFNEYLKMDYIMIEIEIPFIKDKNVYIVSKKDKKILKRGYTNDMDMPCTI